MNKLTSRQNEILDFLQFYQKERATWPSFREILAHFGFRSTNAVMGHLRALERKGFLSRVHGQARTFRLNVQPPPGSGTLAASQPPGLLDIPIYGNIPAGFPDGVEPSGEIGRLQIDGETIGLRRNRRCFALRVRGDSMEEAGIQDGDTVIVEQHNPNDGNIVAALIDGETTLKRFISRNGQPAYLKSENSRYPNLFPTSELVIQGVVRAVIRRL